jgi:hypothetical protein
VLELQQKWVARAGVEWIWKAIVRSELLLLRIEVLALVAIE